MKTLVRALSAVLFLGAINYAFAQGTTFRNLKGTIGTININMYLLQNDTSLSGSYYYSKVGVPLSLVGSIYGSKVSLTERDHNYQETGYFEGTLAPDSFTGTWRSAANKKQLPFRLRDNKEGAALSFSHYYKENCESRDKYKKEPLPEDAPWWDTLCSYISLDLLKLNGDSKAAGKINRAIVSNACYYGETRYSSPEEFLSSLDSIYNDPYGFLNLETTCNPILIADDFLSMEIFSFEYAGGAHPNSYIQLYNYDLNTGKEITLNDIMIAGYEKELNPIAEKIFVKEYGTEGWNFTPGDFKLNENFAISTGGLLFQFNSYEIGPYSSGAPEVFIPYNKCKDLIKPNSIASHYIK
jgi:hypothetical protein